MRILVVQTTRMGDVLQTSPLIQQIRDKHPEAHIAVLVRRMGKAIAERHPAVNEVILYDEDALYQDVSSKDSERLLRAYERTHRFIRELADGHFDLVYNVTHSIASAMLLKLAGVPRVAGAHLSGDWHFVLRGEWTTYFFTSVFSRDYNDLNLCDIFRNFASDAPPCRKLVFEVNDEDRRFAAELLREHHVDEGGFVACLQLGASENSKRWTEERFAGLAKRLSEEFNARIFLLGVKEEAPFGETFAKHAPGLAVPLFGKTNLPQLAALLERANLLVSNDTGTMHLAAAVGCPVTLVSVGHVHYRETGPYGEGHCAVEWRRRTIGRSDDLPGGLEDRSAILPEHVLQAVRLTLGNDPARPLQQMDDTPDLANLDIFMTRFSPDGYLQFYPMIRRPLTERDCLRIAYRAMWLEHLARAADKRTEIESLRLLLRHFTGPDRPTLDDWCKEGARVFEGLAEISQRGVQNTERLLDALRNHKNLAKARQLVAELMALDAEARVYGEVHPPCRPLVLLARFERDNLEGADPLLLAQSTLDIYRACYARARLCARKLTLLAETWRNLA